MRTRNPQRSGEIPLLDDHDPTLFYDLTEPPLALLELVGRMRRIGTGEILFPDGDADAEAIANIASARPQRRSGAEHTRIPLAATGTANGNC